MRSKKRWPSTTSKSSTPRGRSTAPIVTEIVPFTAFYPAESYHQNYFVTHPQQPYCAAVIGPKLEKFEKVFKDKLKSPPR